MVVPDLCKLVSRYLECSFKTQVHTSIFFSGVFAILYIIWGSTYLESSISIESDNTTAAGFAIFSGIILVTACLALFCGIKTNVRGFIVFWLVAQVVQIIASVTAGILCVLTFYWFSLILLGTNVLGVYLWIMMFIYYNEIIDDPAKKERNDESADGK